MSESVSARRQYVVFTLPRELDLYNAERLKQKIGPVTESAAAAVIIDCSVLSYVDSSGVGALVYAYTKLAQRKKPFCFAGLKGPAAHVVKLTGLDGVFPLEDSLEDAESFVKRSLKK